jgi:hypothetical protein
MINISHEKDYIHVMVAGEFGLQDYKEFEDNVLYKFRFAGRTNVLFDLTQMLHYTIDVAIEELRFLHQHPHSFGYIAVVSQDQFINWGAWLSGLLSDAKVNMFDNVADAQRWLSDQADSADLVTE